MEKESFSSLDPSHQLILLCSRIKVDEKEKKVLEKCKACLESEKPIRALPAGIMKVGLVGLE